MTPETFLPALLRLVERYHTDIAGPGEHLSLLHWQLAQNHRLDLRETMPGHVTTSAIILSPNHAQVLLIDHIAIGRWLQPGGHYEPAPFFHLSAQREAVEETGVVGLERHPWHRDTDLPFAIDSHDVPGKASRNEAPHVHHDLQYLFLADPDAPLMAQLDEVKAARWHGIETLDDFAPKAAKRLWSLVATG